MTTYTNPKRERGFFFPTLTRSASEGLPHTNPKRKRGFFKTFLTHMGSKTSRDGVKLPEPLAYFLTWPTYGTWLPGDERGWVKKHQGFQLPDPVKKLEAKARMSERACILNRQQRKFVEKVIADHCNLRNWTLHAVYCRSNHLHLVVSAAVHTDAVRNQIKSWCSRRLNEASATTIKRRWWAEGCSKQFINGETGLEAARSGM